MKKALALVLSAAMVLSMTACGSKAKDPKEVFSEAVKKNSELTSTDMSMNMAMIMKMGEETMDMDMNMDIQMDQINTEKMKYFAKTSTSVLGESMDMDVFYADGYYYMDAMGQKMKMPMDLLDAVAMVEQQDLSDGIDLGWMKDLKLTQDGDNQILDFVADPSKMDEYVMKLMASSSTNLDGAEMAIKDVTGQYVINKEGYYTAMKLTMDVDVSMDGQTMNMVMDIDATVKNPGQAVTVTIPATDDYIEIDPSAMPQAA